MPPSPIFIGVMPAETGRRSAALPADRSPGVSLVFVYGTLKRGFANHAVLAGFKFLGTAWTKRRHALYVARLPHLVRDEPVSQVIGELYETDRAGVERLDAFEGHPGWYRRERTTVVLDGGSTAVAWVYFARRRNGRLVRSGEFRLTPGRMGRRQDRSAPPPQGAEFSFPSGGGVIDSRPENQ